MKTTKIIEDGIEYTVLETYCGDKFWKLNGNTHRENGPAIEYKEGHKFWCKNGITYKVVWADGREERYKNGKRVDK